MTGKTTGTDMTGARHDGWTVVGPAPRASYGLRWRLRHDDGRERVVGGTHLRCREGWPRPRAVARGRPVVYTAGSVVGAVRVLARLPGGARVRLACGCERSEPHATLGPLLARAQTGLTPMRCRRHAVEARRAKRAAKCRWCGRPSKPQRDGECAACERAAMRNGRLACCRAPVRLRAREHVCGETAHVERPRGPQAAAAPAALDPGPPRHRSTLLCLTALRAASADGAPWRRGACSAARAVLGARQA